MTVVYLDSFLLVNFLINYLLLLASGKLAGEPLRRWKYLISAVFGAAYAALTFFPEFQIFFHPVYKAGAAMLMVLIAFGGSRHILRMSAVFLALTCAFSGGIMAIQLLLGGTYGNDGVFYSAMDLKGILISAGLCYGLLTLFFRRSVTHTVAGGQLINLELKLGEEAVSLTALQDSGNTLQDPLTGQPVVVAEGERLAAILPKCPYWNREDLSRPIETFRKLQEAPEYQRFRLLPYRAVGVDCGLLLAVRLDSVTSGKQVLRNCLAALSPTPVSDGGGYHALVGCPNLETIQKERIEA